MIRIMTRGLNSLKDWGYTGGLLSLSATNPVFVKHQLVYTPIIYIHG